MDSIGEFLFNSIIKVFLHSGYSVTLMVLIKEAGS